MKGMQPRVKKVIEPEYNNIMYSKNMINSACKNWGLGKHREMESEEDAKFRRCYSQTEG